MSDARCALVLHHTTGPAEIGVVGPFRDRTQAEKHRAYYGPRLSDVVAWEDVPIGENVYTVTPYDAAVLAERKR